MEEEKYMRRCIQLARNGVCGTAPNPMVGALLVCDGRIIGEGYHVRCGQAHAEVNAIRSVKEASLLRRATLYVTLEPCSHYGKTPPCADLIIEKGIPRIVVGCQDPFAQVAGRGIRKLREAGREVIVGVLEAECRELVRRFITFHTQGRPYITLKWAQSADGYIDTLREGGTPVRLSTELTAMAVHKRRCEHAAILVGTRTALLDNPRLDTRHWCAPSPVRVVLDRTGKLPCNLHLFDGTQPTLVFTAAQGAYAGMPGVTCIPVDFSGDVLPQLLKELHARGLQSLLVEGGGRTLQSFLDAGLWDEIHVEESPLSLHGGVAAPSVDPHTPYCIERCFGHNIRHYQTL